MSHATTSHIQRSRKHAVLLSLGLLMLSMAVFGWGLQYKLSLYQSTTAAAARAPQAKLLSQKERPAQLSASQLVEAPALPHAGSLMLLVAIALAKFVPLRCCLWAHSLGRTSPPLPACYRSIFVRPPPVAAFSL